MSGSVYADVLVFVHIDGGVCFYTKDTLAAVGDSGAPHTTACVLARLCVCVLTLIGG